MPYRRDLLGHFIRRRQPAQRVCTHPCCRGRRVHPENYSVILPNKLLRQASDEDLAYHYMHTESEEAQAQVVWEMERRDQVEEIRRKRRENAQHALFARRLEREEAVEHAYVQAEADTRGNMLSRAGQSAGVNPRSLFTGSEERARRYASPELLEHWQHHGRPTQAFFRGQDTTVQPRAALRSSRKRRGGGSRVYAGITRRASLIGTINGMPRITIQDPCGMGYQISSRDEALIKAWFDEVLPHTFIEGRPIDDYRYLWPTIYVHPMFAWADGTGDADWLTDSRVLGQVHEFQARDGEQGMRALSQLKAHLENELAKDRGN